MKKIWKLRNEGSGFFLVDENGNQVPWSIGRTRFDMIERAFDSGADEILHDYDLAQYDLIPVKKM